MKLISIKARISLDENVSIGPPRPMPALVITRSIRPHVSTALRIRACTCASLVTSVGTPSTRAFTPGLCLLQPLTVDICQNEMCTFSPQCTRCCQPDATCSTGNNSDCASKVRQCHRDCSSQQKNKRYVSTLPLSEDGCQMLTLMLTRDIARSQSVKPLPESPHQV